MQNEANAPRDARLVGDWSYGAICDHCRATGKAKSHWGRADMSTPPHRRRKTNSSGAPLRPAGRRGAPKRVTMWRRVALGGAVLRWRR